MDTAVQSPATPTAPAAEYGDFLLLQTRYRRTWWIWFACCALLTGAALWVRDIYGIGTAVLSAVALPVVSGQLSGKLSRYYKAEIVPQYVGQFCEAGRFTPESGIGESVFRSCGLFDTAPDRYRTEDLIEGRVGKTAFRFAEVHAQKKRTTYTRNGTRTTWVDIFRGFFFVADFNKDFRGQTTLVPNYWGSRWLAGRARVQLENPRLMKEFLVCSTDQTEARYILTPALMERIMRLWDKYPGRLSISFTGSCIQVARSCMKNHYEASIWRPLGKCLARDTEAMRGLTSIVEELNMNTRIWTKE
ncbi:DUF3137 domain-containing protein [uncultured Rikenella sp.]|uniref:DUF3137 domain-containing protein n=1 Tax=uncultured Rikenella sp. TaxID=368003 RepID=UPI00263A0E55|nr:DUF3137 domain-containing protein [uncultured Rikenella sp.]